MVPCMGGNMVCKVKQRPEGAVLSMRMTKTHGYLVALQKTRMLLGGLL